VDGRRFLTLAERIGRKKRIVLLKGGVTEKGRQAASSHTGALAGTDAAIEAICAQSGMVRARSTREFLDFLRTLSQQPPLLSSHIAVITNAGGPGVLAADAAEREGLVLPPLTPKNEEALRSFLPPSASVRNPIDVLGDALADRYEQALKAAVKDPNTDGALVILTPQIMTPAREIAEALVILKKKSKLFPFLACFMGGEGVREAITVLHKNGIPNFSCPESAMHILAALRRPEQGNGKRKILDEDERRAAKAERILEGVGLGLLNEERTEALLKLYELPAPRGRVAAAADEAVKIAEEIGYPVTAKVSSKEILHKTEIGGVIVNLTDEKQVREAFDAIMRSAKEKAPQARVLGVLIQQCLPPGNEFIVGGLKDETAGHLVMVGLGGVYTELFKDTSFRVAPVSAEEAYPMLTGLKSWKLLLGMRGKPQLQIDALADLVSAVSLLMVECPQIREIDLNPVLVSAKSLTILDAKVVLG
jgi:acetyltransferase